MVLLLLAIFSLVVFSLVIPAKAGIQLLALALSAH